MDWTRPPSAPRNRSGSSPRRAGAHLWTPLQHCTLFSNWRRPVGGGYMRIVKFLAATMLLSLVPCVAQVQDGKANLADNSSAQAAPPAASFDQVIDRVTSREQQFLTDLRKYT